MSFPVPKSIAIEDIKGMVVTSIGVTDDGRFIIEFDQAYRLVILAGSGIEWQRRREV